ncbi:rRNA maturation RNase YbeY [Candidatus Nitrospira allomarina]|jgi:probable rRNA maturation factor|uniref:Endoribonuclease YbeY n=1 Tax=Candidatus Nitrospira allomarina TaxID=3020900 RepID=A0AA96GAC0_9BACT|nr:rRNA maturation RNase YbeY [Candidatus Nitrospira allomarina]WNM58389.1 rRNA maturation RNase YbeY [Candidatus Nitrospira allomarina]
MAVWLRSHLRRVSVRHKTVCRLTQAVLQQAGYPSADLSLTFVGKARMQTLNRTYRQRDYATDVLAFPMQDALQSPLAFVGDVVICLPVALAQAPRFGNTADEEILRLLIHGTLHLLGYDHETTEREAKRMTRKERTIFGRLSAPALRLLA